MKLSSTVPNATAGKDITPKVDNPKQKPRVSPQDLLRLLSYTRPYRLRLAIALLALLVAGVLGLAFPQVIRMLIDAAFIERDSAKLNRLALLLVGVFAAQAGFSFLRTYLLSYTGERIVADVRTQVYNHLTSLPAAFFANRRVGELTSRLASDVSVVQTVTTGTVTELLRLSLMLVGGVAIIFITNIRLSLLMLAIVPVVIVAAHFYGRYIRRLSTKVQDLLADANSVLEETLSAIRIVQSFVREEYERTRYRDRIQDSLKLAVKRAVANGGFIAFIILVVYSGIAVVLWFGSRMVVAGQMTAGDLIAFVLYTFFVGGAVGGMTELYGQFNQAIGATRRVFELLDTEPEIKDPVSPEPLEDVKGHVQLIDVHFTYPDDRALPVLKGVSVEAKPGEIIALVGPSGAGKSTLVALIPRFYDVSSGAILVDGHDVRSIRLRDLRSGIGVVPQETTLFGGPIRENIAYGRLGASNEEIEAVARAAHAHEFIAEFPDGYDTVVGERGVKLSGGQRQRIAIARALLKNPAILILDEATSSLDSESERLVQDALETLMSGRTTFVIAHRLSTVRRADRIIVLDGGAMVEEGTHEELLASGGLYKRLYEIQFRDYRLSDAVASEADW
ncbi:MAG TPA: ABC transporter transmembrane domain-containing protein [Blastocatellia bacterium]|nr:ABC transporter transmembrane domain-containing protein [Blastocatellia bacterium]